MKFSLQEQQFIDSLNLPESVFANLKTRTFNRGEYLCHEQDLISSFLIIISGRAKVSITAQNDKTLLLSFYENSGILGEIEFLTHERATCNIIAIDTVHGLEIPFSIVDKYTQPYNETISILTKGICEKLAANSHQAVRNMLYTVNMRICGYIATMQNNNIFSENLGDTSELLGTSYRHVLRLMQQLCKDKILTHSGKGKYTIIDKKTLIERAGDCFYNFD